MIAVDTNVLVYAHRIESPQHKICQRALKNLADGRSPWAIPVFCLGEFLRVTTHPSVLSPPSPLDRALFDLNAILRSPSVRVLYPVEGYLERFMDLCRTGDARGNLVFDAQIAAVCLEHGVSELLTYDRDFDRFRKLKTRSPETLP